MDNEKNNKTRNRIIVIGIIIATIIEVIILAR